MSSHVARRRIRTSILLITSMALAVVGSTIALRASGAAPTELTGWNGAQVSNAASTIDVVGADLDVVAGDTVTFRGEEIVTQGQANADELQLVMNLPFEPTSLPIDCVEESSGNGVWVVVCAALNYGGTVGWDIPTVANGASSSVTAASTLRFSNCCFADNNSADDDATTQTINVTSSELSLFATVGLGLQGGISDLSPSVTADVGDTITLRMRVPNDGSEASDATTVSTPLPDTLTYIDSPDCALTNGVVECDIATSQVGEASVVSFGATVDSGAFSVQELDFTLATPATDSAQGALEDSVSVTIPGSEISVDVTASTGTDPASFSDDIEAKVGDTITYQATVTNDGDRASEPTSLSAVVPAGMTLVSGCTLNYGNVYACPVPTVPVSGSATVTFTAQVTADGSNQELSSGGTLSYDTSTDSGQGSRAWGVTIDVLPYADLSILAVDSIDPVTVGSNTVYTATVANAGPDDITNGGFSVQLGSQLTFVSASSGCTSQNAAGSVQVCDVTLASGASAQFTITAKAATAGTASTTFQLGSNFGDPNLANNSVVVTTTVANPVVTTADPKPPVTPTPTKNTPTSGSDTLTGSELDDILRGLAGDDRLLGLAGKDLLDGGDGTDFLSGGAGDDTLYGGFGGDRLVGGSGDDVLRGGTGDDVLAGAAGNDVLAGNGGLDVLSCGTGADTASGGTGSDLILCRDGSAGVAGRDTVIGGPGGSDICIVDRFDVTIGCERVFRG